MAKKALYEKTFNRKPKFKVRGYTRCRRCGRPRAVFRRFQVQGRVRLVYETSMYLARRPVLSAGQRD